MIGERGTFHTVHEMIVSAAARRFCRAYSVTGLFYSVLPDNAYLSLGKRLHFRGPTLPVIAVATSEVGPAVLLFVEKACQVLRFQTISVPRYQ